MIPLRISIFRKQNKTIKGEVKVKFKFTVNVQNILHFLAFQFSTDSEIVMELIGYLSKVMGPHIVTTFTSSLLKLFNLKGTVSDF